MTHMAKKQTLPTEKVALVVTVCQIDMKKLHITFSAFKMSLLQITK